MTDAKQIAILLDEMMSGDENRLISAAPMLAQFGVKAVPGLLRTLVNDQAIARDYSAFALGLIGPAAEIGIPLLCEATRDLNSSVRYAAIMALSKIAKATDEVIMCLRTGLCDPDEMNQKAARNGLETITGKTVEG